MSRDVRLVRSPVSLAGMVITTACVAVFLVVFLADLFGLHTNPYLGIVFFLILPALLLIGLALIPLGAWIERRRRAAGRAPSAAHWPCIDLNDPSVRTTTVIVFALTLANIVIVSLAAYRGVEYMDTVAFCGQVCHTPMKPQFVAHAAGTHAQVKCVACHVGTTASSMAMAKIAGTRRVFAVAAGSYPRPITATPEQLVAAAETCEQCHSPETFHGEQIRRLPEYADDDQNTESVTTLVLHVGGGPSGHARGIHWHRDPASEIEYVATDPGRQTIPYVRVTDRQGNVREFVAEGARAGDYASLPRRRMDCADCHNRVGHPVAASPERAVDDALARGDLPRALPFVRREAVKALAMSYPSEDVGVQEISRALQDFYRSQPADGQQQRNVDAAVSGTQAIYQRNVFPEMQVRFGGYPSNIGHLDSAGCFRCHDGSHKTAEGRTISQDCELCHRIE